MPSEVGPTNKPLIVAVTTVAALVALAAWLLTGPFRARGVVPTEDEVAQAASRVVRGFQPGDVVRFEPYWFTAPRRAIEQGVPPSPFPHDTFDFSGHPDPLHLLRFQRLWTVAAFSAVDQDDAAHVGLPLALRETWQAEGPVRVSLYDLPRDGLRYDLLRRLGDAIVVRKGKRCTWDDEALRHRCHEQDWKDVYVALRDAGDAIRQCIHAEPHPAKSLLTLTWPEVPLDGALLLHTGFTQSAVRRTDGADTRVRLLLDGEVKADWTEPKNDYVWRETWLAGDGGTHEVQVEISAPEVGWRQLCIDGGVVSPSALAFFPGAPSGRR